MVWERQCLEDSNQTNDSIISAVHGAVKNNQVKIMAFFYFFIIIFLNAYIIVLTVSWPGFHEIYLFF